MFIVNEKMDKACIAKMPRADFMGEVEVVDTEEAADKALHYISQFDVIGIDSETRPAFVKGRSYKVALLQISTLEKCYLFRLNKLGLTPSLIQLLTNPKILKIGLSLKDDLMMLHKRSPFKEQGCIDLQNVVGHFGIQDRSLQKIHANLFGEKISKAQRLSNWEADILQPAQQKYAAIDAWSCLVIYNRLQQMKEQGYEVKPFVNKDTKNEL